jgi:hypothetical protein
MIVVSRWFLAALFAACFLTAGSGRSLAALKTEEGGGTWGAVLQLAAETSGPTARFTVSKKHGRFNADYRFSIRSGSWNGPELASGEVVSGSRNAVLTADLSRTAQADQPLYAHLANSYGYAWVGPLHLSGSPEKIYPPVDLGGGAGHPYVGPSYPSHHDRGPAAPHIDSWPHEALICKETFIGVTVRPSDCRPGRPVRIECKAEDDGHPSSHWLHPGERTELPFKFYAIGTKTICCRAIDDCGRSSDWAKRTIRVRECNRPPEPPVITPDPCDACVNRPVRIAVTPGDDPDGDQVQVRCTAQDASDNPYVSGWYSTPHPAQAVFTFLALGKKSITCVTRDVKGAESEPVSRLIDIRPCKKHCKGSSCHARARTETKISISVISDAESGGSQVQVQRDDDEGHHRSPVSYDAPYVPEYQEPYQAEQEQDEPVDISYGDERIQQDDDMP